MVNLKNIYYMLLIVPIITALFIGIIILTIILQVYTGDDIRKHHREAATKFIKILENTKKMKARIRRPKV